MIEVEFVDQLPTSRGGWDSQRRKAVEEFAAELKSNRGRWAVYPWTQSHEAARAAASRIRRGKVRAFAKGFEAVTREKVLYVRYVGE